MARPPAGTDVEHCSLLGVAAARLASAHAAADVVLDSDWRGACADEYDQFCGAGICVAHDCEFRAAGARSRRTWFTDFRQANFTTYCRQRRAAKLRAADESVLSAPLALECNERKLLPMPVTFMTAVRFTLKFACQTMTDIR